MSSVFISHASIDKPFARKLTRDLVVRGVRVWLDEAELVVADPLFKTIALAIEEMHYFIVVLTPSSLESPWVDKEIGLAINKQLRNNDKTVLTVIAQNCEIPPWLQDTVYLRMETDLEYESGLKNILKRIQPDPIEFEIPQYFSGPTGGELGWIRDSKKREQLLSNDESVRISAIEASKNLDIAVPISLEFITDKSDSVVAASIKLLSSLPFSDAAWAVLAGDDQYIPFGDDVINGNEIVHYDLIEILSPIYDYIQNNYIPKTTLQKLLSVLYSKNQDVRSIALFTHILARYETVLSDLISITIVEEDDLIREIATWGLAEFSEEISSDNRLLNSLVIAANDLVGNVRYQALKGLRHYETEEVTNIIIKMLNDPSDKIAKLAIEELGQRRQDASFEYLVKVLKNTGRRSYYLNNLFKAYIIRSISFHQQPDIETILIKTLSIPRYANAFAKDDRSAKYVVAMCLRTLESHGTPACINVVIPFVQFEETVAVPTKLSGGSGSFWPIEIGKTAQRLVEKLNKSCI